MNLGQLTNPLITIIAQRPGVDMDAVTHVGPEISQHLNAIINLCDRIPNSQNLKDKIDDLRSLFSTYVPMQDNMLEKDNVAESVVHHLNQQDPMNKSEIKILGGAGRYTMSGLRRKAARESAQLADDLTSTHVNYKAASYHVKQVANTVNTIVAALSEFEKIGISENDSAQQSIKKLEHQLISAVKHDRSVDYDAIDSIMKQICADDHISPKMLHDTFMSAHGTTPDNWIKKQSIVEQQVKHDALKAVGVLRNELVKYGRTGKPITDAVVEKIMHEVLAKTGRTDMNSLLQTWKSSKAGLTPLQWAKQAPDIHDRNIHNTDINAPIDESIKDLCIIEMYETMKIGLGDKAWVAISKRLKAEGYNAQLVEDIIDRAIVLINQ